MVATQGNVMSLAEAMPRARRSEPDGKRNTHCSCLVIFQNRPTHGDRNQDGGDLRWSQAVSVDARAPREPRGARKF